MIFTTLITYPQAIVLGLLQGVSELFPISSLGHSVILPSLLGWDIHQNDQYFLSFLVATHLATALVLLGFFWHDWVRIVKGIGRSLRDRGIDPEDADAKLGWLLVVGTIPAGILGLLLDHALRDVFASASSGAIPRSRSERPRPFTIRTQSLQKNPSSTSAVARWTATRKLRKYGSFWWMFQPSRCGRITACPRLEIGNSSEKPWSSPRTMAWK